MKKIAALIMPLIIFAILCACQNESKIKNNELEGIWASNPSNGEIFTIMNADGTFHCAYANIKDDALIIDNSKQSLTGKWKIEESKIIWIYDQDTIHFKKGEKEINEIVSFDKNTLSLREMDGTITTFKKVNLKIKNDS
jgi:hypothetical protein